MQVEIAKRKINIFGEKLYKYTLNIKAINNYFGIRSVQAYYNYCNFFHALMFNKLSNGYCS